LERQFARTRFGADDDPVLAVLVDAHAEDRGVERGQRAGIGTVKHRFLQMTDHASILASAGGHGWTAVAVQANASPG
jgi:hypothetical protein